MSSKVLGFGVVGLGMGMSRSGTIAQTEGAKLVAVADLVEDRRKNREAGRGTPIDAPKRCVPQQGREADRSGRVFPGGLTARKACHRVDGGQ